MKMVIYGLNRNGNKMQKFNEFGTIVETELQEDVTPAKDLHKSQLKKIIKNSKTILLKAISQGGSTIRDFKNTTGKIGQFQKKFKVYSRDKKNCKRLNCLGTIDKIIQSNRSTFYCKICQK